MIKVGCGGAAGWGNPWERPAEDVLMDVKRGFVSPEGAERDYGVVLADGGIDKQETGHRREQMRTEAKDAFFDFGEERDAFEAVWSEASYEALTNGLAALPTHWRFFIKGRVFEAVEALDPDQKSGDGETVARLLRDIVAEYPQLAVH